MCVLCVCVCVWGGGGGGFAAVALEASHSIVILNNYSAAR